MGGGATIQDVTRRVVMMRIEAEDAAFIESRFREKGDKGRTEAYIRALQSQVKGVLLTKAQDDAMKAEIAANHRKNQIRKIEYAKKHGTTTRAVL